MRVVPRQSGRLSSMKYLPPTFRLSASLLAGVAFSTLTNPLKVTPALVPPAAFDRIVLPTGDGLASIAVADLNHDHHPDLIVANFEDGTLTVLFGDGKDHFTPARGSPFACGPSPNDIAVADLNGDGNLDLIVANTETPYITVLLGDGRGGFAPSPHSPFATQSFPHVHGVVAADFIGNGKAAVVTDSWGHNQVLMLPGDGAGNLMLPGALFPTGKRPYQRLRSADFNRDGRPDIVTTDMDDNAVSILLSDGRTGFRQPAGSPFPAGKAPWEVAIDDFNRDGNLDLAVIPYDRDLTDPRQLAVTILLGDGRGGFAARPDRHSDPHSGSLSLEGCRSPNRVAAGDINGDGYPDIVVSCAQNNRLIVFWGSQDGGFERSMENAQTGWSGLALADLKGDGKNEIIVSNGLLDGAAKSRPGTLTIFVPK
jgi:FG-GAP-like repeat